MSELEPTVFSLPADYHPDFLREHNRDEYFSTLWNRLPWEQRPDAPRRECWLNDYEQPYTYGSGAHARTYAAHKLVYWADNQAVSLVAGIQGHLNQDYGTRFDCCFVNGYAHGREHLGWHADDSPEMDLDHPIAVVSFGAEREIWFRPRNNWKEPLNRLGAPEWGATTPQSLGHGSLLLMRSGMQRDWQHRIPKSSRAECGPRVSLTFRKLVR